MMRKPVVLTAVSAVLLLAAMALPSSAAPAVPAGAVTVTAWLSTYDWWNNSPPGYGIEYPRDGGYPTVHDWACCRDGGSYADPITFASQPDELPPGTRIYIPVFKRYFIKEDLCQGCYTLPRAWQFDLWVGGVGAAQNGDQASSDIVNLWQRDTVIIRPPRGLPVSTVPFRFAKA